MANQKFVVDGMSCPHCVMTVKKALAILPLKSANVEIGSVEVEYDEKNIEAKDIKKAIDETGFTVVD